MLTAPGEFTRHQTATTGPLKKWINQHQMEEVVLLGIQGPSGKQLKASL